MGQQRAGKQDHQRVGVGEFGVGVRGFRASWQPSVGLAVPSLLPLKFVVPNFSCRFESPGEL